MFHSGHILGIIHILNPMYNVEKDVEVLWKDRMQYRIILRELIVTVQT